jgi:hypothetical protein
MKQTGGKWPGTEEFVKLIAAVKVDAVRGPVSLDDMRNPVQNRQRNKSAAVRKCRKSISGPADSWRFWKFRTFTPITAMPTPRPEELVANDEIKAKFLGI